MNPGELFITKNYPRFRVVYLHERACLVACIRSCVRAWVIDYVLGCVRVCLVSYLRACVVHLDG